MREEVKEWMKQSNKDLRAAKHDIKSKDYFSAVFWCQQSVEKAFKALLIKNTENFPKIHDLSRLADLNNAPAEIKERCAKIDPTYLASRYPDWSKKFSKKDAEEIIKEGSEVLKWIKKNLN